MSFTKEQVERAVEVMFRKYDSDNNGVLDKKELKSLLTEAYKLIGGRQCTNPEVDEFIMKFDQNGDEVIDK